MNITGVRKTDIGMFTGSRNEVFKLINVSNKRITLEIKKLQKN